MLLYKWQITIVFCWWLVCKKLINHYINQWWPSSLYVSHWAKSSHHYNDVIMSAVAPQITTRLHCLLNCRFRRRSKKTSKLRITGLCAGNSPVTGEFPAQKASNVENVSIWWCHHDEISCIMKLQVKFLLASMLSIVWSNGFYLEFQSPK